MTQDEVTLEIARLVAKRDALKTELAQVYHNLNSFRVKCSGCRCMILPNTECECCISYIVTDDELPQI